MNEPGKCCALVRRGGDDDEDAAPGGVLVVADVESRTDPMGPLTPEEAGCCCAPPGQPATPVVLVMIGSRDEQDGMLASAVLDLSHATRLLNDMARAVAVASGQPVAVVIGDEVAIAMIAQHLEARDRERVAPSVPS